MMKIRISCCFDMENADVTVATPEGWALHGEAIDEETNGFCPKHAAVEPWLWDQCPGCVAGWHDCGLWDAFAYAYPDRRTIDAEKLAIIRTGVCPYRVNGSLSVSNTAAGITIDDLDMSNRSEAGSALADAIEDYIEQWPTPPWRGPDGAVWGDTRRDDSGRDWKWRGGWEIASR